MQTLIIKYSLGNGRDGREIRGAYPLLRTERFADGEVAELVAKAQASGNWGQITEHHVHDDGMTRAEDDAQFASMWRAERQRAA